MSIKVAIVIPTYNESKYIKKVLDGISNQDYDNFELVVVDNGSTDNTVELLKQNKVAYFVKKDLNISGLRNFGAVNTTGEILVFLDGDCVPVSNWLSTIVKLYDLNTGGVLGGPVGIPKNNTWVERVWYLTKPKGMSNVKYVGSANFIISRLIFNEIGGFNEKIQTGEDYELCRRVALKGYPIISNSKIKVIHYREVKTIVGRIKKEIWYGLETESILKTNKMYLPFISSIVFIILHLALIYLLIIQKFPLSLMAFFLIFLLILMSSFHRCSKSKNYKYLLILIPIFYAYLLGRSISLVKIFYKYIVLSIIKKMI